MSHAEGGCVTLESYLQVRVFLSQLPYGGDFVVLLIIIEFLLAYHFELHALLLCFKPHVGLLKMLHLQFKLTVLTLALDNLGLKLFLTILELQDQGLKVGFSALVCLGLNIELVFLLLSFRFYCDNLFALSLDFPLHVHKSEIESLKCFIFRC